MKLGTKLRDGPRKKTNQGESKHSQRTTKVRKKQKPSRGQG